MYEVGRFSPGYEVHSGKPKCLSYQHKKMNFSVVSKSLLFTVVTISRLLRASYSQSFMVLLWH